MDNGLSGSNISAGAEDVARVATRAPTAAGMANAPKLSREQKVAGRWDTLSGVMNFAWMADIMVLPVVGIGMLVSKMGMPRAGAAIKMIQSPVKALTRTHLNDLGAFGPNTMNSARQIAIQTGGKASAMAPGLASRQQTMSAADLARTRRVAESMAPMRQRLGRAAGRLEGTGGGRAIEKLGGGILRWRQRSTTNQAAEMANSLQSSILDMGNASKFPLLGFRLPWSRENEVLRNLSSSFQAEAAHGMTLTGAAQAAHYEGMLGRVEQTVAERGLSGREAKVLFGLGDSMRDIASVSRAVVDHGEALNGGVKGVLKGLSHMGGRMTALQAVVALGAVAGTFGIAALSKHENNVGAQALKDLADDIGDKNNPLVVDARTAYVKQSHGRVVSTALNGVAQSTNVVFAGAGALAGGMKSIIPMMGLQMALPKLGELAVPNNPFLSAYVTWQKAERENTPLSHEDKVEQLRQMVGSMRMVRAKGGYYNHLSGPVAQVLCDKDLSLRDTVRLMADTAAFTQVTVEANEKLQALKAKATADDPTHPLTPHDHNDKGEVVPHSDKNPIHHHAAMPEERPHLAAAKPGMLLAADRALEGRVDNVHALQNQGV